MKTTWESFIAVTSSVENESITDFDDNFYRRNPEYKEMFEKYIPTGEIVIISGKGFNVIWNEKHECDCEYCEREEQKERFFQLKEDAEKEISKIKKYPDEYWDIELEEDVCFVKAVKQIFHKDEELF